MKTVASVLFLVLSGVAWNAAALTVAPVFGDGMVLQREIPVPFFGHANPGETVTVEFQAVTRQTAAGDDGRWQLTLPPFKASAVPAEVRIHAGSETAVFANVLVGEVWVGSGQSNMAGRVISYKAGDQKLDGLLAGAPYGQIRLLRGGRTPRWNEADAAAVDDFSAILFAFGMRLQRELGVPVGLMAGAVGGTPSGQWLSREAYETSEPCKAALDAYAQTYDRAKVFADYEAKLSAWQASGGTGREPKPPAEPGALVGGGEIGGLYEKHIRGFVGYGIRGVLWDQGEAGTGIAGLDQFTLMGALMAGWRREWQLGEFPFLYVQKPSGGGCAYFPGQPMTHDAAAFVAELPDIARASDGAQRVEYVRMMAHPNAWMVPTSDLGAGIHPANKWAYGNRAAHLALVAAHGSKLVPSGPRYRSHTVEGSRVRIHYDCVGQGLVAAHGVPLQGFALEAENGRFVWARAEIDRDSVLVWSERVPRPGRVRYAYASKPAWANLFNRDGLPALAFDTVAMGGR